MEEIVTLRELCRRTGASRRAVQGYEKEGLVQSVGRNKYGYLLYDGKALARVERIRFLQRLALTRKEICRVMDAPPYELACFLRRQTEILAHREAELRALLAQTRELIQSLEDASKEEIK